MHGHQPLWALIVMAVKHAYDLYQDIREIIESFRYR
jgi:hypothetical protein